MFWGILRALQSDGRSMRFVLPRMPQPIAFGTVDTNGVGIFDPSNGDLVGLYTLPDDNQEAATASSIAAAVRIANAP